MKISRLGMKMGYGHEMRLGQENEILENGDGIFAGLQSITYLEIVHQSTLG